VFLIEHMDMVWLSVTQRYLINVCCISILAKEKEKKRRIARSWKLTIFRDEVKVTVTDFNISVQTTDKMTVYFSNNSKEEK